MIVLKASNFMDQHKIEKMSETELWLAAMFALLLCTDARSILSIPDPNQVPLDRRSCEFVEAGSYYDMCNPDSGISVLYCDPGEKRIQECVGEDEDVSNMCGPCDRGFYQPYHNNCSSCRECKGCGPHQETVSDCTQEKDAECRDRPINEVSTLHMERGDSPSPRRQSTAVGSTTNTPVESEKTTKAPLTYHGPTTSSYSSDVTDGRNDSMMAAGLDSTCSQDGIVIWKVSTALCTGIIFLVAVIIAMCVNNRRLRTEIERLHGHTCKCALVPEPKVAGREEDPVVGLPTSHGQGQDAESGVANPEGRADDASAGDDPSRIPDDPVYDRGGSPIVQTRGPSRNHGNVVCRSVKKLKKLTTTKRDKEKKGSGTAAEMVPLKSTGTCSSRAPGKSERDHQEPPIPPQMKSETATTSGAIPEDDSSSSNEPQAAGNGVSGAPKADDATVDSTGASGTTPGAEQPNGKIPNADQTSGSGASSKSSDGATAGGGPGGGDEAAGTTSLGESVDADSERSKEKTEEGDGQSSNTFIDADEMVSQDVLQYVAGEVALTSLQVVVRSLGLKQNRIEDIKDHEPWKEQGFKMLEAVLREAGQNFTYRKLVDTLTKCQQKNVADTLIVKFHVRT